MTKKNENGCDSKNVEHEPDDTEKRVGPTDRGCLVGIAQRTTLDGLYANDNSSRMVWWLWHTTAINREKVSQQKRRKTKKVWRFLNQWHHLRRVLYSLSFTQIYVALITVRLSYPKLWSFRIVKSLLTENITHAEPIATTQQKANSASSSMNFLCHQLLGLSSLFFVRSFHHFSETLTIYFSLLPLLLLCYWCCSVVVVALFDCGSSSSLVRINPRGCRHSFLFVDFFCYVGQLMPRLLLNNDNILLKLSVVSLFVSNSVPIDYFDVFIDIIAVVIISINITSSSSWSS